MTMKENILNVFKFLTKVDISNGIPRRLYPKLLTLLKTYPKSNYARTSRGIYASTVGNFWWVRAGEQKYGWERTLRSIISNFDCVDNTDVCDCKTFLERAHKLTRARVPYWVRCFFYKYNTRKHDWELMPSQNGEGIPDAIVIIVDDGVALLIEATIDFEANARYFKITNYCFVRGVPAFVYELLKTLTNDKPL